MLFNVLNNCTILHGIWTADHVPEICTPKEIARPAYMWCKICTPVYVWTFSHGARPSISPRSARVWSARLRARMHVQAYSAQCSCARAQYLHARPGICTLEPHSSPPPLLYSNALTQVYGGSHTYWCSHTRTNKLVLTSAVSLLAYRPWAL